MVERRATIEDVAGAAGVSRGTVSRVLNDSPRVSPTARVAVERAVRSTGYRANPHARSLAGGRNDAIAVLLTRPHAQLFEDPTFSLMLQGISDGVFGTDLGLVLLLAATRDEQRRAARFIHPSHVDALVHLSPLVDDPMLEVVAQGSVPAVVCGNLVTAHRCPHIWSVTTSDRDGAVEATRHLVLEGARRVAMIAGPDQAPGSRLRIAGYRDALGDAYDAELVEHGDYGRDSGHLAMGHLLDRRPDLDAVFCASDRMAVGAMDELRARGREVPGDVLVAGFDDHELAARATPALTTVRQPIRRIGHTAVDMLREVLDGGDPGHRVHPAHLVVRESSVRH